jgi:hypothetical protein
MRPWLFIKILVSFTSSLPYVQSGSPVFVSKKKCRHKVQFNYQVFALYFAGRLVFDPGYRGGKRLIFAIFKLSNYHPPPLLLPAMAGLHNR